MYQRNSYCPATTVTSVTLLPATTQDNPADAPTGGCANFSLFETSSRGSLTLARPFLFLGLKGLAWLRRRAASSARRPCTECARSGTTSSGSGYWPRRSCAWVRTVVACDEPYTSETCGACGFIHKSLGGRKVFACPKCGYRVDRDASVARNIMLRYLTIHYVHV